MAARAYPLDRDTFFAKVPVWEQSFTLSDNVEMSGLSEGAILQDELGPQLWRGSCSIEFLPQASAREVEALLSLVRGPGKSFLIWRIDRAYPKEDPDGSVLGASSPNINALPADARLIDIGGLPSGYTISPGDMFSFTYGSSPTRYALHRVVSDAIDANGSGIAAGIEVEPPIRNGASVSAAITLIRPYCKAIIVPQSADLGTSRRNKVRGLSFDFIQTLR